MLNRPPTNSPYHTSARTRWRQLFTYATILVISAAIFQWRLVVLSSLQAWGGMGAVCLVCVTAIMSLTPFPVELFLWAGIVAFGYTCGILFAVLGATISAGLVFYAVRKRNFQLAPAVSIEKQMNRGLNVIHRWSSHHPKLAVYFLRAIPMPLCVANYIIAQNRQVPFSLYFSSVILASTLYYVMLGLVFIGLEGPDFLYIAICIAVTACLICIAYRAVNHE